MQKHVCGFKVMVMSKNPVPRSATLASCSAVATIVRFAAAVGFASGGVRMVGLINLSTLVFACGRR